MISKDEDALICDLAETYGIYDYKQLPLSLVAVFACGLRDDSRIKLRMSGQKTATNTLLLAGLLDGVNLLLWSRAKNKNRPKSILSEFIVGENKKDNVQSYKSGEDFEEERKRLLYKDWR